MTDMRPTQLKMQCDDSSGERKKEREREREGENVCVSDGRGSGKGDNGGDWEVPTRSDK